MPNVKMLKDAYDRFTDRYFEKGKVYSKKEVSEYTLKVWLNPQFSIAVETEKEASQEPKAKKETKKKEETLPFPKSETKDEGMGELPEPKGEEGGEGDFSEETEETENTEEESESEEEAEDENEDEDE